MKAVGGIYKKVLRYDKKEDYFFSLYLFRPLARIILSLVLTIFPEISPDLVTGFSLLSTLIASFLIYKGLLWLGAFFVFFSFLFDCMDGTLARMRAEERGTSLFGVYWDFLCDRLSLFLVWLALSWFFFCQQSPVLMWANTIFFVLRLMYDSLVLFLETRISAPLGKVFLGGEGEGQPESGYRLRIGLGPDLIWVLYILVLVFPKFAAWLYIAGIGLHILGFVYIGVRSVRYGVANNKS